MQIPKGSYSLGIHWMGHKQNCESQMICCHTVCPHGGWWSSHLDARLHMSRASSTVCSSAYWVRVPSPCTVFLLTFNSEIINSHELAKKKKKKVQKVSCNEKCTKGLSHNYSTISNEEIGTSLVVQWLRIHLPMQRAQVWSLVRELRSHILCGN